MAAVHAALVAAPAVVSGRTGALARPEAWACLAAALALAAAELRARPRPEAVRLGAPGTWLALTSALALYATTTAAAGWPSMQSPWTWAGAPVAAIGIALRAAAMRALGEAFGSEIVRAPGRRVVTSGVYRLRHPSELGLVLFASGVALLGGSAIALALTVAVIVPATALRVALEERAIAAR